MPEVPRYGGPKVEARPLSGQRVDENATSATARGAAQVSGGLQNVADVYERVREDEARDADNAALLEADNSLDGWENANVLDAENGAFTKKGKDAFDLPNQVLPKFDEEAKRVEGSLGSERAKVAFRAQSQRRRQQISQSLERHEFGERQAFYDEQDTAKLRSSAEMAGNYYNDPARIATELGKQDSVVDSLGTRKGWSADQVSEAKRANHSNVHTDVVNRYLARGEFRKGRNYFDEVKDQISSDAATRIEAQFTAERDRATTEVKQSMNDQLRDITVAAANGLPVSVPAESTLKAIYGEHEGAQRYKIAAQAQQLSPKVAQMQLLPETQLLAFAASAKPTQQEGAADQQQVANFLEQRAGEILRERDKDPAGFMVKHSPATRDAWIQFAQAKTDDERDAAAAGYLKTLRADRERLQISGKDVLPDAYADSVAEQINNPKSAEALASDIQLEARRWGGSWPSVYEQLAPKLSDTAAVIGSGVPRSAAVTLAGVANLTEAEMKSMLPPGSSWKDVQDEVGAKFEDFQRSLPSTAARMNNAFKESATRMAARYVQGGADVDDAVQRAYNDLVGSQYQLIEFRSVPMRVPNQLDEDVAETGARVAVANYQANPSDLLLPEGSALTAEEYADSFTAHVQENGYWITNPSGSGLRLYVDGGPVPRGQGSTVEVSWEQLLALNEAEEQKTADQYRKESIKRQLAR